MFASLLLVLASAPASGALPVASDWEDLVAPPDAGVVWLGGEAAEATNQAVSSMGLQHLANEFGAPKTNGLVAWRGRTVVLVALPERQEADCVPYLEALARANVDRELIVATLLPAPHGGDEDKDDAFGRKELERRLRASRGLGKEDPLEIQRPSERLAAGYVDPASPWMPTQHLTATVVGPSGERLGDARLPEDQDRLLEMVEAALLRYGAPPLPEDLPDALGDVQSSYFEGHWDEARSDAQKIAKRSEKKDPLLAAAADALARQIDEFERTLYTELTQADSSIPNHDSIARIGTAARRGFPKGRAAEYLDEILARAKKTLGGSTALDASLAFVDSLPSRPALFAEVQDSRAKKHAKALEKLLARAASYSGPVTQRAQALLARHESAPKKAPTLSARSGTRDQ